MYQYIVEIARQKWRLFSVVISLVLINVALGMFVTAYQLPQLAALQSKWSELRRQGGSSGRVDAASLYQQGTADLEKIKNRIPEKREFASILNELFESAASCDVEVGSVTYRPVPVKEEQLLSYAMSMTVSGRYSAVKSYLADLQGNQELIVVDSVSFTNSDPYAENVTMNLHVTVYLREGV